MPSQKRREKESSKALQEAAKRCKSIDMFVIREGDIPKPKTSCSAGNQEINLVACTSPNSPIMPEHGTSTSSSVCSEDSKDRNSCPTTSTIIIDEDEVKKAMHDCFEGKRVGGGAVNTDGNNKQHGNRSFKAHWITGKVWAKYCKESDAILCTPCSIHSQIRNAFATGYKDWTHAKDTIKNHEMSASHLRAVAKWIDAKKRKEYNLGIDDHIEKVDNSERLRNRQYLLTLIDIILLHGKLELPLRGHAEDDESLNKGNFLEIVQFTAKHSEKFASVLTSMPKNAQYQSPEIQNELISSIGSVICDTISTEVRQAMFFTLMVDGTQDIGKIEQESIVLRYLADNFTIRERFLCFFEAKGLDAASLTTSILSKLNDHAIDIKVCVAQGYDGAAVMAGSCKGVQTLIRKQATHAIYVHCMAHRLNLVLINSLKEISLADLFFNILEQLYVFVSSSNVHSLFVQLGNQHNNSSVTIKRLVETRWNCHYRAVDAVKKCLPTLLALLDQYACDPSVRGDKSIVAAGLLRHMQKIDFFVCLETFHIILNKTIVLSDALQQESMDLSFATALIQHTILELETLRSNPEAFQEIWQVVHKTAEASNIQFQPSRSRVRQMPKNLSDCLVESRTMEMENPDSCESFRLHFFNVLLDRMLQEMKRRFSNESIETINAASTLNPKCANFLNQQDLMPFVKFYAPLISLNADEACERVKTELSAAKYVLSAKLTGMNNLRDVALQLEPLQCAFPCLMNTVKIALTLPVSTASNERAFSSLKRIKSYLRSAMKEERLTSLASMAIEKDITETLRSSPQRVLDVFKEKCKRRIAL